MTKAAIAKKKVTGVVDEITGRLLKMDDGSYRVLPMGPDGRPVTRTKETHPYNYDEFVVWESGVPIKNGVYSDRLYQWNPNKHDRLCEKHFGNRGQYWSNRSREKIEAFLKDYFECFVDLKLVRICEGCNQASGYPVWRFEYTYSHQIEVPAEESVTQESSQ